MKNTICKFFLFVITLFSINKVTADDHQLFQPIDNYLKSISKDPDKLRLFFHKMPKGGDLHNHLAGDSLPENLLRYGVNDPICIDNNYNVIFKKSGCTNPEAIIKNKKEFSNLVEKWSMKNFDFNHQNSNKHFFAVFDKFFPILVSHSDAILAETVTNAAAQNERYLELMVTPDHGAVSKWANKIEWNLNFKKMRNDLLKSGIKKVIILDSNIISTDENRMKKILGCDKRSPNSACEIHIAYLYQAFREQAPAEVFTQLLVGFELSVINPKVVGVNLVQPEDGTITVRDYDLQMKMISFFHSIYPTVKIALHAGELPQQSLVKNHIKSAIEIAHADRIGHGSDILHEENYKLLLEEMAAKNIPVEINLTSNADVIDLPVKNSPLPLYLKSHVPIIISTDDEGVLGTNLSNEYFLAFSKFKLSYETLKNIDRNSLMYSFLPGKSLWDTDYKQVAKPCRSDHFKSGSMSRQCRKFLSQNKKAFMQWELEEDLLKFEKATQACSHIMRCLLSPSSRSLI